jgi:hypothetical protein
MLAISKIAAIRITRMSCKVIIRLVHIVLRQTGRDFALALSGLLLFGCIEEYSPNLKQSASLIVINGSVIKEDSIQYVTVSRSTPVSESEYSAVSDCMVWATNGEGVDFLFEESSRGKYTAVIPQNYMVVGSVFKISVVTPNGNEYDSDYETIYESSPIDSLYYLLESFQSSSMYSGNGLQFYADLKADVNATKNYRWVLEETWEARVPYDIGRIEYGEWKEGFMNFKWVANEIIEYVPPIDSFQVCYKTRKINEIYSSTTRNLTVNEKKKIPLRYLAGSDVKQNYQYSLLVKQYALSEKAYEYWSTNQVMTAETGGIYQTQPTSATSNLCNINDPDEVVLGYFWTASYSEQRINFKGPLNYTPFLCGPYEVDPASPPFTSPRYWSGDGVENDARCFICALTEGTYVKPDFFD